MQLQKLGLPSSRCYRHRSSRQEGQANSPQQEASLGGIIFKVEEVSFLTLSLMLGGTMKSSFRDFPPQFLESDLAEKLASRRVIFLSKQNYQTPILENQGFSDKTQVRQLWNQIGHLKLVRSKYFLFPFGVLI